MNPQILVIAIIRIYLPLPTPPAGALRDRGGPHPRYVFRGGRGVFKDPRMSAIL